MVQRLKKILLLLSFVFIPCSVYATDWTQDANAIATYLLNEGVNGTAADSSDSLDLTPSGTPDQTVSGKFGAGVEFDGGSDRKLQISNSAFNVTTGDLTITCWIRADNLGQNNEGTINEYRSSGNTGYKFNVLQTNTFQLLGTAKATTVADNNSITFGSFIHLAAVKSDTGNDVTYYVGGVAKGGGAITDFASTTLGRFQVGVRRDGFREFDGIIDDNGLFSDAKNITDINSIMDNGLDGLQGVAVRRAFLVN